jgi:hypothetical protein
MLRIEVPNITKEPFAQAHSVHFRAMEIPSEFDGLIAGAHILRRLLVLLRPASSAGGNGGGGGGAACCLRGAARLGI